MIRRLGQVLLGTLGFVAAIPIIMVPPPGDGNWVFFLALLGKLGLGLGILLLSLDQYRRAAFPPGSAALSDPVMVWLSAQEARLYGWSKLAWLASQFLMLFMPVLLTGIFLAVVLRPLYVTCSHANPSLALLRREGTQTLAFVLATLKGLFFLTLSTLLGSSAALITFVTILRHPPSF